MICCRGAFDVDAAVVGFDGENVRGEVWLLHDVGGCTLALARSSPLSEARGIEAW